MHPIYYLCTYIFPVTALYALWSGGLNLLILPLVTFVIII